MRLRPPITAAFRKPVRQRLRAPHGRDEGKLQLGWLASGIGSAVAVVGGVMIWYYLRLIGFPGLTQSALASGSGIASLVATSAAFTAFLMAEMVFPALVYFTFLSYSEWFGADVKAWPLPSMKQLFMAYLGGGGWSVLMLFVFFETPKPSLLLYFLMCFAFSAVLIRVLIRNQALAPQNGLIHVPAAMLSAFFACSSIALAAILLFALSQLSGKHDPDWYWVPITATVIVTTSLSNSVVGQMFTNFLQKKPTANAPKRLLAGLMVVFLILMGILLLPAEGRFLFEVFELAGVRYGPVFCIAKTSDINVTLLANWKMQPNPLGESHIHLENAYVGFDFGGKRLLCDAPPTRELVEKEEVHCLTLESNEIRIVR